MSKRAIFSLPSEQKCLFALPRGKGRDNCIDREKKRQKIVSSFNVFFFLFKR